MAGAAAPRAPQLQISAHGRDDWCHLCGVRNGAPLADIWFPDNAEHDRGRHGAVRFGQEYIRICADCGELVAAIARGAHAEVGYAAPHD